MRLFQEKTPPYIPVWFYAPGPESAGWLWLWKRVFDWPAGGNIYRLGNGGFRKPVADNYIPVIGAVEVFSWERGNALGYVNRCKARPTPGRKILRASVGSA
jgi:hypothetical protein